MSENSSFPEVMGTELSSTEEGHAVVSLHTEEWHLNASGTIHGGVVATLIDVAMAEALNTMTEEDEQPFTIEVKVNYMEPVQQGTLNATAQVRKGSKRATIVEAEVVHEDSGEVVALASGTYAPIG